MLINFIVDDLFSLVRPNDSFGPVTLASLSTKSIPSLRHNPIQKASTNTLLVHTCNTPSIPILLTSSARGFLKYNTRYMRNLSEQARNPSTADSQRTAFLDLEAIFQESPIKLDQFERLLSHLDNSIRQCYQKSQISDTERKEVEQDMLISAEVPEVLMPAVNHLFTELLERLKGEVDMSDLYFLDVSPLGSSDDRGSDEWKKEISLDAIRKVKIGKDAKVRRCTRCCSVMEETAPMAGASVWMFTFQRTCFCGSHWGALGD